MKLTAFFCLLFLSCSVRPSGSTYYIDYHRGLDRNSGATKEQPWKVCPAQKGFEGDYSHRSGDQFIFKGGIVWPSSTLPIRITKSGARGRIDTYGADSAWYEGDTFTQPVFTADHKEIPLVIAENQSWFTIRDLKFIDYGTAGASNRGKGLEMNACDHYAIQFCTIAPQAWLGLYLHSFSGRVSEEILIEGNDISAAGQAIVLATEAPHTVLSRVTVKNNRIHDLSSQITGETHGDGIHTWNSPDQDTSQYITHLTISGNTFFGDFSRTGPGTASMTSLIYLTDPGKKASIINNVLTYSKATSFSALIWIRYFDDVQVINNTLAALPGMGGIGIMVGQGYAAENITLKDNIFSNFQSAYYIYADASPTVKISGNCSWVTSQAVGYWNEKGQTLAEWRARGNDVNGVFEDPRFRSPSDFQLRSDSPCRGKGALTFNGRLE